MPRGLLGAIDSAVYSAGQIRDRFSPDGWLALSDLRKTVAPFRRATCSPATTRRAP